MKLSTAVLSVAAVGIPLAAGRCPPFVTWYRAPGSAPAPVQPGVSPTRPTPPLSSNQLPENCGTRFFDEFGDFSLRVSGGAPVATFDYPWQVGDVAAGDRLTSPERDEALASELGHAKFCCHRRISDNENMSWLCEFSVA